jgi:hypothetical protein
VNCSFDSFVFGSLFEYAQLKSLDSLEISKDQTEISFSFLPSILNLISLAELKIVNFSEMCIDIAAFLRTLETSRVVIEELNLAGNRCSKNYVRGVILPPTLASLDLSNVTWQAGTFLAFLSQQPFEMPIAVKLSNAHFTSDPDGDPFAPLSGVKLPTQVITLLAWDRNRLTPSFLEHLETFSHLQTLSLEMCQVQSQMEDEIPVLVAQTVRGLRLSKLSLAGTFRYLGVKFMSIFKDVFMNHPTLQQLNLSDIAIGSSGLNDLKDIILNGKYINQVWCDGSHPDTYADLLQFFNDLAETDRLIFIAKPRNDMASLVARGDPAAEGIDQELRAGWRRLVQVTRENARTFNGSEGPELATEDAARSPQVLDPGGTPLTPIDASWEMSIEVGFGGDVEEWDDMKQKFTIERLIGVKSMMQEEDADSLIELREM